MLVLGRVAALDVAERWIRRHDPLVAEVLDQEGAPMNMHGTASRLWNRSGLNLESHEVLGLVESVEPAAAEGERPEVLVDDVEELLGPRQPATSIVPTRSRAEPRGVQV